MAETYRAKKKLQAREKPNAKAKAVQTKPKGSEFSVYEKKNGWGNIARKGGKWVNLTYCEKLSSTAITKKENTDSAGEAHSSGNKYYASDAKWYGTSTTTYRDIMRKYVRAFGSPPRYTPQVDPYYESASNTAYTGRAMMKTWFSDPAIFSLCPGKVKYLPGFSSKNKDQFYEKIKGSMSGSIASLAKSDHNKDLNGQLYAFKSAYKEYINVVNLLARATADYLGIGGVSDLIWGGSVPLNQFDYGWFTSPNKAVGNNSIFTEMKNDLNSAVSDDSYIHFFVNSGNVSVGENFNVGSGETWFEQQLNSGGISDSANTIAFLFNGAISSGAEKDLERILETARTQNEFLGGLSTMAVNYLKGGRIVFPKMITSMDYEKSISCEFTFSSLYGDKRSIFRYVLLPSLHLLPLGVPKQISENMYTYPFLCRCSEPGNVNCDLAYMSSLEFTRGGSDSQQWTIDGLPTSITARFTITPLYSNMMVTSARNPFLYMNNSGLIEYLGNMCGLDLKVNNLDVKVKLAKHLLKNYVMDTPRNIARGLVDNYLVGKATSFLKLGG